jgi:uncharacterized protein
MKLQPDKFDAQHITGYGPGWVAINGEKQQSSIVIGSEGERFDWPVARFEDLNAEHFEDLGKTKPELIVFGTGEKLRFAHPKLMAGLMQARIGVETMDTLAACRTYNILAGEGRHVIAALLIEPASSQRS